MFNTVRYHPEQVDIQNAAGILASQFDYNISVQQGPLLDASLDPTTNGHHHHRYPHDYQLPPSRNQLGLDIPTQTLSNTRLPPPPTAQGDHVYFNSSTDRQYAGGGGYPASGMPIDSGHQGSSSSAPQQSQSGTSAQGTSASNTQEPRKESSGVVIACRQW